MPDNAGRKVKTRDVVARRTLQDRRAAVQGATRATQDAITYVGSNVRRDICRINVGGCREAFFNALETDAAVILRQEQYPRTWLAGSALCGHGRGMAWGVGRSPSEWRRAQRWHSSSSEETRGAE